MDVGRHDNVGWIAEDVETVVVSKEVDIHVSGTDDVGEIGGEHKTMVFNKDVGEADNVQ